MAPPIRFVLTALLMLGSGEADATAGVPVETPAGNSSSTLVRRITRPVHTYSIVAIDRQAGLMGVAVQSHWFSVGSVVAWAEAGAGAVATQSFVNPAYGVRGLELMKAGVPAPEALESLTRADEAAGVRQVAFVDKAGHIAVHTGDKCIEHASHYQGRTFAVQANMMVGPRVVPAMRRGYEQARGDLAERLLATLEAAQAAGGDIRGSQSAAMVIVRLESTGRPWEDRVLDLRVEDHPEPVEELRRLVGLYRVYEEMNQGDLALERGDPPRALQHYAEAARGAPDNLEVKFWHAVTLATNGREKEAMILFRQVFARDPNWLTLVQRLHEPGIIPRTKAGRALMARIVAQGQDAAGTLGRSGGP